MAQAEVGEFTRRLKALLEEFHFAELPGYAEQRSLMLAADQTFRQVLASALEPILNAEMASHPHQTYEEKKDLAKWVNAELRQFGLAIRDPKSGNPSILRGNTGDDPDVGRFRLDYADETGRRHHPVNSVTLLRLTLMPDDLTRTPYGTGAYCRK